ncbi:protein translocation protein, Sec62 family protein [Purpureocillium lavendulum]|uniref:Protein translocation protein, Sec62 family protein n=1 Tax=Purpureocillium lavendulum TaxID=1247861 RepID=A0AB34FYM9_9HYPO|nr:protein translocation protein, Sec62 family protein [Purpureocillium lavendulum]
MPALQVDGLLNPHLPVLGGGPPRDAPPPTPRALHDASIPIPTLNSLTPTSTSTTKPQPHAVVARQQSTPTQTYVVIPTTYGSLDNSPSPGVVVGIVLGSVAGFLLLLFLLYSALGFGPVVLGRGSAGEEIEVSGMDGGARSVLSFRSGARSAAAEHKHHRHTHHHHQGRREARRGRATEMFEVRTRERVVSVPGGGTVPVVVDAAPRGPPPPPNPGAVPPPPRRVPPERHNDDDDDDDDEVVVIEEHSPPPQRRRESRRSHRSDDRRSRGSTYYRDAPDGPPPPRSARRESSRRYSSSRDVSRER